VYEGEIMQTAISDVAIQRLGINKIDVGQVGIGPIHIGQVILSDVELNTTTAGAELRNFRVTVTHALTLEWHLHIEIPGHVIDEHGTEDLPDPVFTCDFGNVSVPGLEKIRISMASLTADNVEATATPVANVQLGAAVAEAIRARNLVLPAQGFSLAGIGVGSLQVAGFGAPAASLESVTIQRLHGEATPPGGMTLSNLALSGASIPDITGNVVDVIAAPLGKAYHLDLGCLNLTLKIKPQAEAHIDQLVIGDVSADTRIGRVELHNVIAPFELLNLTLSELGIETMEIPSVALS
jgi:hypothetical protein